MDKVFEESDWLAFVGRFWDDIFLRCRGTAPTPEERESTHVLTERAALIAYREHVGENTLTTDQFLDAISRASKELIEAA